MNAQEKIEKLISYIKEGRTVRVSTPLRVTDIEAKHLAQWEKAGRPLLRAGKNSMYMASGKKYVCIDFCRIEVF